LIGNQKTTDDNAAHTVTDKDYVPNIPESFNRKVFTQRIGRIGDAVRSGNE
jgi:hypothetical protein